MRSCALVCLSVCLSLCLSLCLSVSLSLLYVSLSVSLWLSLSVSLCVSLCLSLSVSLCVSFSFVSLPAAFTLQYSVLRTVCRYCGYSTCSGTDKSDQKRPNIRTYLAWMKGKRYSTYISKNEFYQFAHQGPRAGYVRIDLLRIYLFIRCDTRSARLPSRICMWSPGLLCWAS